MKDIIASKYKHLINESISNWSYTLPTNKQQQIVDFYLMTMLNKPSNETEAWLLERGKKKLLINLKEVLLEELFFCISSEIHHFLYDLESQTGLNDISRDALKKIYNIDDRFIKFIEKYELPYDYPGRGLEGYEKTIKQIEKKGDSEYLDRYTYILTLIKRYNISKYEFVDFTKKAFLNIRNVFSWTESYGGRPWSRISQGWIDLYNAKTESDMIVYIDHVYDLIHNTGPVFNKLTMYLDSDQDYRWIKKLLTYKRYAKNVWELLPLSSLANDRLIIKIIKETTGINKESAKSHIQVADKYLYLKTIKELKTKIANEFEPYVSLDIKDINRLKLIIRNYRHFENEYRDSLNTCISILYYILNTVERKLSVYGYNEDIYNRVAEINIVLDKIDLKYRDEIVSELLNKIKYFKYFKNVTFNLL